MAKAAFDKIAGGLSEAAEIAKRDAYTTRLRDDLDRLTRERDEALAEAKRVVGLTQDAKAVHINMLHGGMARLTWEQVKHLYAAEFAAAEAALAKRDEEVARMRGVLTRCRTILGNMAKENEGAIFYRWPISHEPLRADARHLLPIIDEALPKEPPHAE